MRFKERTELSPERAFAEALEEEDQGFFIYLPPGVKERVRGGNPSTIILVDKRKRPKALHGYRPAVEQIRKILRDPLQLDADLEDPTQWDRIVAVHGPKVKNNGGYVDFPHGVAARIEVYHIKGISGGVVVVRGALSTSVEIEQARQRLAHLTPAQVLEYRDFMWRNSPAGSKAAGRRRHVA